MPCLRAPFSSTKCLALRPISKPILSARGMRREATPTLLSAASYDDLNRREALVTGAGLAALYLSVNPSQAQAFPGFQKDLKKRKLKVPESEYQDGPEGLKYYDVELGRGALADVGERVVVHYDARWRGVTFMTSRMGVGVTGGTPLGFDVGAKGAGGTLAGLDLGVRGMRVGGQRRLLVPPQLAYGSRGFGEIPGDATLEFEVELLSIKTSPFGYRSKLVEG